MRVHLGDDARAADAFLRAIDLDGGHLPTLRRLCDVYFTEGDHVSLAEMAEELEQRDALLAPETPSETLARVAVSAAVAGDKKRAAEIAAYLGAAGAGPIAAALAEACTAWPADETELADVARKLCVAPGPPLVAVKAVLAARADKDAGALKLAVKM